MNPSPPPQDQVRRASGAALAGRSLVRRLVLLAAVWCVALLAGAGVLLTANFHAAALQRFDQGLSEDADDLYAGAAVALNIGGLRDRYRMTIVLTTHYMEEAERLCTRFGILRRGKLVALGTLDEIRVAAHLGEASLNELFALFTDDDTETVGGYGETAAARQVVQRVG